MSPRKKQFPGSTPSQSTDAYWVFAERKTGQYPEATDRSGKWLIFVPLGKIDVVWERIKQATEEGKLGGSAKVATARPNPNAADPTKKVICVYSYDWKDREDIMRIRAELRALGIAWQIPYKADADTDAGKYRVSGHTRISKYYE
ncbi:MAG: DUF1917 domain-containing protein [Elusimicrobia bacterium]|nr:DUF1917 domain-containing protein [Elusimicrobiota bacterium]